MDGGLRQCRHLADDVPEAGVASVVIDPPEDPLQVITTSLSVIHKASLQ
jgi:hypothetical protein